MDLTCRLPTCRVQVSTTRTLLSRRATQRMIYGLRNLLVARGIFSSSSARMFSTRPQLRGVVWDMDGTLSVPNLDFKLMYQRCGVDMGEDILAVIETRPQAEKEAAELVIEEMEEEGRRTLQLMPGAVEALRFLQDRGVPTAITTRNTAKTVAALTKLMSQAPGGEGLLPFEPAISRDNTDVPTKPDPAALLLVAEKWGLASAFASPGFSSGIVMIGDSPSNDVGFGKAAGAATMLLDSGRKHTEGGSCGDADMVVAELTQVPALLSAFFTLPALTPNAAAALKAIPSFVKQPAPVPQGEVSLAAASGDVKALAALHAAGRLLEPPGSRENTPLIWAVDSQKLEAVHYLLSLEATDVNHQGYMGATAVCRACRRGDVEVLRALLGDGRLDSVNVPNDHMQHPLHFAAFKKNPGAVLAMLQHGADTAVVDRKGRTPAEDTSVEAIREAIYGHRRGEDPGQWLGDLVAS